MRILVTGSRDWPLASDIENALWRKWWDRYVDGNSDPITVVHGGARGVDQMAGRYVRRYPDRFVEEVHEVPREAWKISKRAGHDRNQHMVDLGADVCLAFQLDDSRGTADCIRRARAAGIPVEIHRAYSKSTF